MVVRVWHEAVSGVAVFDIESIPESDALTGLGVFLPDSGRTFGTYGKAFSLPKTVRLVNEACDGMRYVAGHNVIAHDIRLLRAKAPDCVLCRLPAIDTLYLSPLAFPRNPYHRLVKDYKLAKDSANDPVADAKLSWVLLQDCTASFAEMDVRYPRFYGHALTQAFPTHGFGPFFEAVTSGPLPSRVEADAIWFDLASGFGCPTRARELAAETASDPALRLCLAYALAWLSVSGGNSVVPPWVRHRMPAIVGMLDALRGHACGSSACAFCSSHHDVHARLKLYFGYDAFRPIENETPPLQETVVRSILAGEDCLAVLPTGAGKSLCYQLPALMRSEQRNVLTVIISPLQSLMKDQVDGLERRGMPNAATINGMLTPLERTATLEGIRTGSFDLIWIAPEQLRNTTVKNVLDQREIGLMVIDEAHCLSKWGHDFRPDYMHIAEYLKERAERLHMPLPQLACFTATAKPDVMQDIVAYFRETLGTVLTLYLGGHERGNLRFEVVPVPVAEKVDAVLRLLDEAFPDGGAHDDGGAIVFTATQRKAEDLARRLRDAGWLADHFHGGRTPDEKREVQDAFLRGELTVIAATNAFGMGVDKPDIRLVIHLDTPGSLENYLQEAGRAGRDREPAQCVLLYDPDDLDAQFSLTAMSRVEWRDVTVLLTALRTMAGRSRDRTVVVTSGEILRDEEAMPDGYDGVSLDESGYDTKIKMIISSLERAGKMHRGDNRTAVIQGMVLVKNMADAEKVVAARQMSASERTLWLRVLDALMQAGPRDMVNTDSLSDALGVDALRLLGVLKDMREARLLTHDMNMTAFVHHGVQGSSRERLQIFQEVETELLKYMEEQDPDAEEGAARRLNCRTAAAALQGRGGAQAHPDKLRDLLFLWRAEGLMAVRKAGGESMDLTLKAGWPELRERVAVRRIVAQELVRLLLTKLPPGKTGKNLLVGFQSRELADALAKHLALQDVDDLDKQIESALRGLHRLSVITLQAGLAVFRPAMTLYVSPDETRFRKADFVLYENFFKQKTLQVHIMGRYALLGAEAFKRAMALVRDYFSMTVEAFVERYFPKEKRLLELPTSMASFERIVTSLRNDEQERIVTFGRSRNMLVLAGPGSGKTRCIVHRIAYLLRVKRIPARHILALAFNRSAAGQIRRRLTELVGRDANGVRVYTYHSLAMRLTGASLAGAGSGAGGMACGDGKEGVFDRILRDAVRLLRGEAEQEHGFSSWRDKLLGGLAYILVDEYQDINELEYDFLSLLAGRGEGKAGRERDDAPTIMAVGDDDQNIYAFTGANVVFIRRFRDDYDAEMFHLTTNYRSLPAIVGAADALIAANRDRMKTGMAMRSARAGDAMGMAGTPVRIIQVTGRQERLKAALELCMEAVGAGGLAPESVCVLCRTNEELDNLLQLSRALPLTVRAMRRRGQDLTRTREFLTIAAFLGDCAGESLRGTELRELVETIIEHSGFGASNIWVQAVRDLLEQYVAETSGSRRYVEEFVTYLYDAAREGGRQPRPEPGCVVAATMHGAKGLEFPVVIIPGQPAQAERGADNALGGTEEERRLYYVAMTRAMDRLICLDSPDCPNPFLAGLAAETASRETMPTQLTAEDRERLAVRWLDLTPGDVVLDYPGFKTLAPRIQPALFELESGFSQGLRLVEADDGKGMYIILEAFAITEGRCHSLRLAKLSKKGVEEVRKMAFQGFCPGKVTFMASQQRLCTQEKEAEGQLAGRWFVGLFRVEFVVRPPESA
ncbi:MAG: RecQ family ATP-dependent DNA helicase [Desulfovibrionaceae bacterium]